MTAYNYQTTTTGMMTDNGYMCMVDIAFCVHA